MKQLIELLGLNVQVIQTAVLIWGVFEVRLVRFKFSEHMRQFHGVGRRATDGKDDESTI